MKKVSIVMLSLCLMGTLPASAQFGKLLDKAKAKIGGSGAGKKSGSFATVWESEFENKATRIAVVDGDGSYVVGTVDNSASVLDKDGKAIWNGDYNYTVRSQFRSNYSEEFLRILDMFNYIVGYSKIERLIRELI